MGDAEERPVAAEDHDHVGSRGDRGPLQSVGPAELPRRDVLEDAGDAPALEIFDDDLEDALDRRSVGLDDDTRLAHVNHG